jgi:hypothetical protein
LRTSRSARQPLPTPCGGIGERSVNNLHQLLVGLRVLTHLLTILLENDKKEAGQVPRLLIVQI